MLLAVSPTISPKRSGTRYGASNSSNMDPKGLLVRTRKRPAQVVGFAFQVRQCADLPIPVSRPPSKDPACGPYPEPLVCRFRVTNLFASAPSSELSLLMAFVAFIRLKLA